MIKVEKAQMCIAVCCFVLSSICLAVWKGAPAAGFFMWGVVAVLVICVDTKQ